MTAMVSSGIRGEVRNYFFAQQPDGLHRLFLLVQCAPEQDPAYSQFLKLFQQFDAFCRATHNQGLLQFTGALAR